MRSGAAGSSARKKFAEVVLPHLDDAFTLARWMTGNRTDAEDIVQDACLRAFKGLDGFAGGNGRSWLLAIVRNSALTWLAKNRPKAMILTDDPEAAERATSPEPDVPASPEAAIIARDDAQRLTAALAALPLPYREALVMREINGASYREIAEITEVPIGTVMSRLSRARALLLQTLGEPLR
jgi:RNA polymerase sigma-70 factor (ECF subfamily)